MIRLFILGMPFTKSKTTEDNLWRNRHYGNQKRKIEFNQELQMIKRSKIQDCDLNIPEDNYLFGAHVASRLNNITSNYSKCVAMLNIHKVLLEAEMDGRNEEPSAPPLPKDELLSLNTNQNPQSLVAGDFSPNSSHDLSSNHTQRNNSSQEENESKLLYACAIS